MRLDQSYQKQEISITPGSSPKKDIFLNQETQNPDNLASDLTDRTEKTSQVITQNQTLNDEKKLIKTKLKVNKIVRQQ